jgi:hypothetical protein
MSLIGRPNRAYGVGETKSQNAVIKVYTADELRRAITQVYQLPSGVGTIEIAGDIVITEPIKLQRYIEGIDKPREITFQGVSGVKIINGNKINDQGYRYYFNANNNRGIPIFDIDIGTNTTALLESNTKYNFKDLTINTEKAAPFGTLVGCLFSTVAFAVSPVAGIDIGTITISNIKAHNLGSIFGNYAIGANTSTQSRSYAKIINASVKDFIYSNTEASGLPFTSLNTESFGLYASNISNIQVASIAQLSFARNDFVIADNEGLVNNTFNNIFANVNITVPTAYTNAFGPGNTISAVHNIYDTDPRAGFSYLNTNLPGNSGSPWSPSAATTYFKANSIQNSFGYGNNTAQGYVNSSDPGTGSAFHAGYIVTGAGGSLALVNLPDTITNIMYDVDIRLIVQRQSTDTVNVYHIKTVLYVDSSGTVSSIVSTTISAQENANFTVLTGMIPTYNNATRELRISPSVGGEFLRVCANVTVVGSRNSFL